MPARGKLYKPTPYRVRLFEEHLWLVKLLYRRWNASWRAAMAGCDGDDIMQAGRMGLWLAALKYDKRRKLTFQAIATPCVQWAMHDAVEFARYGKHKHGRPLIDHSQMLRYTETRRKVRE